MHAIVNYITEYAQKKDLIESKKICLIQTKYLKTK